MNCCEKWKSNRGHTYFHGLKITEGVVKYCGECGSKLGSEHINHLPERGDCRQCLNPLEIRKRNMYL